MITLRLEGKKGSKEEPREFQVELTDSLGDAEVIRDGEKLYRFSNSDWGVSATFRREDPRTIVDLSTIVQTGKGEKK